MRNNTRTQLLLMWFWITSELTDSELLDVLYTCSAKFVECRECLNLDM